MNKFVTHNHRFLIKGLLVSSILLSPSLLAQKVNILLDLTPFLHAQQQLIAQKNLEQENKLKQLEAIASKTKTSLTAAAADQSKMVSVPECNCDDPLDSYNYPNNFVYSSDKQKLYRVNPYCKCAAGSVAAYSGVVVNNALNPFPSDSNSNKNTEWNIQY